MKTLIRHARIVSPDFDSDGASLLLEDGRIHSVIHPCESLPDADLIIDAAGRIAMPGFFDIHSHGADGHDVSDASPDAVCQIARRKLGEGVTTWLPTTLTQPPERLEEIARNCAAYIRTPGRDIGIPACSSSMVDPEFCRIPGLHIEGPFINPKNAGAQNPNFIRPPDPAEFAHLHSICPIRILSLAPELPGALELIRAAALLEIVTSAAHTSASAADIATAKAAGLTHLTHFCNAMTPLHHREIGVVGASLLDDSLKLEIICDGVHLCPDMLRLLFKLIPIDRLMLITDSIAASWLGDGETTLGGRHVIVKNGIARLKEGGALAGSTLRYNEGVKNVFEITGQPLHQIVKTTSWNQAQSLGLPHFGKLEPGFFADIVLLNKDFSVWKTWVGGKTLETDTP